MEDPLYKPGGELFERYLAISLRKVKEQFFLDLETAKVGASPAKTIISAESEEHGNSVAVWGLDPGDAVTECISTPPAKVVFHLADDAFAQVIESPETYPALGELPEDLERQPYRGEDAPGKPTDAHPADSPEG